MLRKRKSSMKKNKRIFNPFDGRNPDEVWAEVRKNKGPRVTREEAMRTMEELRKKEK